MFYIKKKINWLHNTSCELTIQDLKPGPMLSSHLLEVNQVWIHYLKKKKFWITFMSRNTITADQTLAKNHIRGVQRIREQHIKFLLSTMSIIIRCSSISFLGHIGKDLFSRLVSNTKINHMTYTWEFQGNLEAKLLLQKAHKFNQAVFLLKFTITKRIFQLAM